MYPKIPGDGREFCVTTIDACKIRAEDGRNVQAVDISNFINNLPFGKDTSCFSSMDASGSTSQATSIVEVSQNTFGDTVLTVVFCIYGILKKAAMPIYGTIFLVRLDPNNMSRILNSRRLAVNLPWTYLISFCSTPVGRDESIE